MPNTTKTILIVKVYFFYFPMEPGCTGVRIYTHDLYFIGMHVNIFSTIFVASLVHRVLAYAKAVVDTRPGVSSLLGPMCTTLNNFEKFNGRPRVKKS